MLSPATLNGAVKSIQDMPKLEGFQMCLPLYLNTYFEVMEIMAVNRYGQKNTDLIRMLTLIPEI